MSGVSLYMVAGCVVIKLSLSARPRKAQAQGRVGACASLSLFSLSSTPLSL
jgi:hypothetical protein